MNTKKKIRSEIVWFFSLVILAVIIGASFLLRGSEYFSLKAISETGLFFPIITVSSLLDSVNPCAFSVLLLTIAFLFNVGKSRKHIAVIGGLYVFGIFLIYILIGFGILEALSFFGTPKLVSTVGAYIIILFGLVNFLGGIFPKFPVKLGIPSGAHKSIALFIEKASYPAGFFLGVLVGLFEFPCTGGPYLFVLSLLHDHATFWEGFFYLFWYNIVFVIPLVAMLFLAANEFALEKVKEWKKNNAKKLRVWGSLAMVLLGVFILLL